MYEIFTPRYLDWHLPRMAAAAPKKGEADDYWTVASRTPIVWTRWIDSTFRELLKCSAQTTLQSETQFMHNGDRSWGFF
jgi:hypothetical protein